MVCAICHAAASVLRRYGLLWNGTQYQGVALLCETCERV